MSKPGWSSSTTLASPRLPEGINNMTDHYLEPPTVTPLGSSSPIGNPRINCAVNSTPRRAASCSSMSLCMSYLGGKSATAASGLGAGSRVHFFNGQDLVGILDLVRRDMFVDREACVSRSAVVARKGPDGEPILSFML